MELGITVRDKITGFKGIVTGITSYISGCTQALVIPPIDDKGNRVAGEWFDVQRLERIGKKKVVLENAATPGCDQQPPCR